MLNPAARRLIAVVLALAGASLACERAEILIVPAQPAISTPRNVVLAPTQAQIQATATSGSAATPIAQASPTTEAGPIASETPAAPAETPTSVVALPTDTPLPPPPSGGGPQPIPPNATFTQQFTVSNEGGSVVGRPVDMTDGRTITWASLRDGNAAWIFDLGSQQPVTRLRVWAQPDGGDPTTLLSIQVSNDRTNWTTVYTGSGDCGVPNCDTLAQKEFVDLGFNPTTAQYVRMNGGPTRFAFAEAQIAVAP